jgi:Ribosomal protein S7p/S5e
MMHRQGTKNIAKPVALGEKQRTRFALQWILKASEKKNGKTVEERLAREIIAVVQGSSEALKKKEEVHRFAMVNRYMLRNTFFETASLILDYAGGMRNGVDEDIGNCYHYWDKTICDAFVSRAIALMTGCVQH